MTTKATSETYGIAAVVRRTGLSAPNIRMWEKRYGAVVPDRTPSNRRLYSSEDLARLSLLHSLTERGHAISNIANLSLAQLQQRLSEEDLAPPVSPRRRSTKQKRRVLVIGSGVSEFLSAKGILDADCVAQFDVLETAIAARKLPATDLLVIMTETLFPETITSVRDLVARTKASRTILIYRFAASKTATALAKSIAGLTLLAAPVEDDQLRRECLVQLDALGPRKAESPPVPGPVPDRLYTPEQLARLARISTTVECECPQHLAGLLQSLAAFETYSRECEDRNPQDALLHAFLHRTTAKVRRAMEEALEHVVHTEGITLE